MTGSMRVRALQIKLQCTKVFTAARLALFNLTNIIYHERGNKFIFMFFHLPALCSLMHVHEVYFSHFYI